MTSRKTWGSGFYLFKVGEILIMDKMFVVCMYVFSLFNQSNFSELNIHLFSKERHFCHMGHKILNEITFLIEVILSAIIHSVNIS